MEMDISGNIAVPAAPPGHLAVFEQHFLGQSTKSRKGAETIILLLTQFSRYE
jgi:hypothetical protein